MILALAYSLVYSYIFVSFGFVEDKFWADFSDLLFYFLFFIDFFFFELTSCLNSLPSSLYNFTTTLQVENFRFNYSEAFLTVRPYLRTKLTNSFLIFLSIFMYEDRSTLYLFELFLSASVGHLFIYKYIFYLAVASETFSCFTVTLLPTVHDSSFIFLLFLLFFPISNLSSIKSKWFPNSVNI